MAGEGSMPEGETSPVPEGPQMTVGQEHDMSMESSTRMGMENQKTAQQAATEQKGFLGWAKRTLGIGQKQ